MQNEKARLNEYKEMKKRGFHRKYGPYLLASEQRWPAAWPPVPPSIARLLYHDVAYAATARRSPAAPSLPGVAVALAGVSAATPDDLAAAPPALRVPASSTPGVAVALAGVAAATPGALAAAPPALRVAALSTPLVAAATAVAVLTLKNAPPRRPDSTDIFSDEVQQ